MACVRRAAFVVALLHRSARASSRIRAIAVCWLTTYAVVDYGANKWTDGDQWLAVRTHTVVPRLVAGTPTPLLQRKLFVCNRFAHCLFVLSIRVLCCAYYLCCGAASRPRCQCGIRAVFVVALLRLLVMVRMMNATMTTYDLLHELSQFVDSRWRPWEHRSCKASSLFADYASIVCSRRQCMRCVLRGVCVVVLLDGATLRGSSRCGCGVLLPRGTALCVLCRRCVCGVLAYHMCGR